MAVRRSGSVLRLFATKAGVAALILSTLTACSPPPYDPATAEIVVIGTFTKSENRFALTSTLEAVIDAAIATNAGEVTVLVMNNGRPVEVYHASLVVRRGGPEGDVENDPRLREKGAKAMKEALVAAIATAADTSGELNAFGMYEVAAGISGPATVVLYSSFMQTTQPLAITNWEQVGPGAVEIAAGEGRVPTLDDKRVINTGVGDTGGDQLRAQEHLVERLFEQVQAFCQATDAPSCTTERAYGPVRGVASQVPVPIIPIPIEPVIFDPSEVTDGATVVFDQPSDLTFEPNSAALLPGAVESLAEIGRALPDNAFVGLTGHTATYGPRESSLSLSVSRCEAVRNEIIKYHAANRVSCRGVGFDEPIVDDVGPDGSLIPVAAQQNRVVRFEIYDAEEGR